MIPTCVLFDLDGTLLDTHDLILESMRYATRKVLGREVPDDVLMAKVGTPLDSQMNEIAELYYGMPEKWEELSRVYRAYNEAIHDERVRTFDGVPEMLATLQAAGARLGVVTSKRHELAVRGLTCCGIDGFFELVVGPDDWSDAKPHSGGVAYAQQQMGVLHDEAAGELQPGMPAEILAALVGDNSATCWYVGDSPYDMRAGNGAGCFTVAALWGMFPRDVLAEQNPNALCETPSSLADLLAAE